MTPQTVACQAPLPTVFSGQEYWSGLPFPAPGNHPDPGMESASLALASRWGNNGKSDRYNFIFLGSKITVDSDCRHEIKRHLLLGRKAMTNPDSVLKSGDITLPTKVHIIKAMVFTVVMYG